jgi:hypothetical protein
MPTTWLSGAGNKCPVNGWAYVYEAANVCLRLKPCSRVQPRGSAAAELPRMVCRQRRLSRPPSAGPALESSSRRTGGHRRSGALCWNRTFVLLEHFDPPHSQGVRTPRHGCLDSLQPVVALNRTKPAHRQIGHRDCFPHVPVEPAGVGKATLCCLVAASVQEMRQRSRV